MRTQRKEYIDLSGVHSGDIKIKIKIQSSFHVSTSKCLLTENVVNFKSNDHAKIEDSKIIFRRGRKQFAAANGDGKDY